VTVARSALLLALASIGGGLLMAAVYGRADGLRTAAVLAATGAPVLVLSHLLAHRRERIGPLARQFAAGLLLSVGLSLAGIGAVAAALFVSAHDAFTLGLMLAFAGAIGVYSAVGVAAGVMRDLERVRTGLRAVGAGEREVRIETRGRDEIADLAAAATTMAGQLREREAERDAAETARRDLIAAVSHDLRTPLASLRLLAEAIEDEVVDSTTRRRYVEQLGVHIRSLGGLIDDLFELARLQAGEIEWSLQQVQLDELVGETVEAMQPHARERGIVAQVVLPAKLPPVRANPEKVQRVLFNLIQNAIRHTPRDGTVTVRAERRERQVEIEVADTGEGIAPSERERVFEPFHRGGTEAARTRSGAGLGLTICRAIVEAHGGQIHLLDSGSGTRVSFTLPLAPALEPR
jgi:signal transduction histidine kinase